MHTYVHEYFMHIYINYINLPLLIFDFDHDLFFQLLSFELILIVHQIVHFLVF